MQNQTRAVRVVTIGLVVCVALFLTVVAWTFVSIIDLPFGRVDRSMQITSRVEGHMLRITGTTNLPDDAFVDWYLWRESDSKEWPSGDVVVRSGAFAFDADLTDMPSGAATAYLSFSCDFGSEQPKPVTDVVGEHCEHLGGEQVYVDSPGDPKQLSVPVDFKVP